YILYQSRPSYGLCFMAYICITAAEAGALTLSLPPASSTRLSMERGLAAKDPHGAFPKAL
ncbi:hypothetical protein KEJ19_07505, partial [Candidatus Bathyarchaeota archaeon]|nr:hypothetical protein [Candidatus Bathyarchaeota archaeon]